MLNKTKLQQKHHLGQLDSLGFQLTDVQKSLLGFDRIKMAEQLDNARTSDIKERNSLLGKNLNRQALLKKGKSEAEASKNVANNFDSTVKTGINPPSKISGLKSVRSRIDTGMVAGGDPKLQKVVSNEEKKEPASL